MSDHWFLRCAVCFLAVILSGCGGGGGTAPNLVAPTLTLVAPPEGPPAGGTAMTLRGGEFTAGATVTVGGNAATAVQVVDDTRITCRTPPGTAGATVDVAVTTAGGTDTLVAAFTYRHRAPTLTAVDPTSGGPAGGTTITLTGTGFDVGGVSVTVGGSPATGVAVVSDTRIRCVTPPGTPGPAVSVAVTTAGGGATLPAAFTYLELFFGTYHYAAFWGDPTGPAATAEWGTLMADGMGTVLGGTVMTNTDGTVDGPFTLPQIPYDLDTARRITWEPDFSRGGISADGSVAALATIASGVDPSLTFLIRREGTFSAASLSGTYHLGAYFFNNPTDGAAWGSVTFDGAGGFSFDVANNLDGVLGGPFLGTGVYAVTPNGTVTYTEDTGQRLQGGVLMGGDLVILSGGTRSVEVPLVIVLIRQSTSASTATLNGSYHNVNLFDNAAGTGSWTAQTITADADGAGTMTNNGGTLNVDGTIASDPGGGSLTYAITADGTLTFTGGADAAQGGVSSDGRFAFLAGATAAGAGPQFWFLWR